MRDSLQIGKHQLLEPKEVLRERCGAQTTEYLVKWSIVTQGSNSSNQSDSSSTHDGKNDKSILVWMTKEEVKVCCNDFMRSGFTKSITPKQSLSGDEELEPCGNSSQLKTSDSDSEDYEDMRADVQKLVLRARRQMKKSANNEEMKPIKNISYTLKVLSTYASLGSLATVFRQTGALDLILELLWSKEVEIRRHAGRMLRALASHDAGSRAYVLLSLIQDRHGQMTSSDHDADFENRNTVMEMFAETSSGEEANAVSLDFMQIPQVPGKALFKLMKCYLKVTSLLDIDSQLTSPSPDGGLKKEMPKTSRNALSSENNKFMVAMAISDLIFELCEVMGWNNKTTIEDSTTSDKKTSSKEEDENLRKEVISKYQNEFLEFMLSAAADKIQSGSMQKYGNDQGSEHFNALLKDIRKEFQTNSDSMKDLLNSAMQVNAHDPDTGSSEDKSPKPGKNCDPYTLLTELKSSHEEAKSTSLRQDSVEEEIAKKLLPARTTSHCIFSPKPKETLDPKLLSDLLKRDFSDHHTSQPVFRKSGTFPSQEDYVEYLRTNLRQGWHVRMTQDEGDLREGDEGVFRKFERQFANDGHAEVYWYRLARGERVPIHSVEILNGKQGQKNEVVTNVPEYLRNPENLKLWPVLLGQDVNKLSNHPYSSGLGVHHSVWPQGKESQGSHSYHSSEELTRRQWWEVLFFIGKLKTSTQSDVFSQIHDDISTGEFPSCSSPEIERNAVSVNNHIPNAQNVLKWIRTTVDSDPDAEAIFQKSAFCSRFLKMKRSKRKTKGKETDDSIAVLSKFGDLTESKKNENDSLPSTSNDKTKVQDALSASEDKENEESSSTSQEISKILGEITSEVACSSSDEESTEPKQTQSQAPHEAGQESKVRDYLYFICHQTTNFLNTFIRFKTLKETFKDLISPISHFLKKDAGVEDLLDRISSAEDEHRVLILIFLHPILMRAKEIPFTNQQLNQILFKLQALPEERDKDLCIAWMECIRIILVVANIHAPSKMRGTEVIVATSGCLAALFRIMEWFPDCIETTMKAIQCLSLATRAAKFFTSSEDPFSTSESQVIREVVSSIASAADGLPVDDSESPPKTSLTAFFDALNVTMTSLEKDLSDDKMKHTVRWTDIESNTKVGALYEGICVHNVLITDHKDLMERTHKLVTPIIKRGMKLAPGSSFLFRVMKKVKEKIDIFSPPDDELFNLVFNSEESSKPTVVNDKLEVALDELLDRDNFSKLTTALAKLIDFLKVIIFDKILLHCPQVHRIVNTLFPSVIFPHMNQKLSLSELSQCVGMIEHILFESESPHPNSSDNLSLILEEKYRPLAISTLLQLLETLSGNNLRSNLDSTSSSLLPLVTKTVALLQRIADVDRDSAVVMCGLEAKQVLTKSIEKQDSLPKASELIEFLSGYERHRTLHSKLLVVVLGGTIGIALRCMEDARRLQENLEIPLLNRLFESLCQGSDFDVKEDKCWDRMEVSSNQRQCLKLTDGNIKTYWESNGSSGSHWINIFMKKGVIIRKMVLQVSQEDSSYMPARFVIMGGTRPSDITHQLSQITVSTTDNQLVVLENQKKFWPIIRICIRRCQQGGIDTRIRGVEIIGPKPSFWPVLRQQLYIRTCLAYFIRARAWISSCVSKKENRHPNKKDLMNHGILDLSSRIVQAIQHEQDFADSFLPNDESALVLGQAFRNAVISPLVAAVLDSGVSEEKKEDEGSSKKTSTQNHSLIFQLVSQYHETSRDNFELCAESRIETLCFHSRLRCLTRLLVDLNPNQSTGVKHSHSSTDIKDWQQKVQSKALKDSDSARTTRSKVSSPPFAHSLVRGSSKSPDPSMDEGGTEEMLESGCFQSWCPGLTPLARQWCYVTLEKMHFFLCDNLKIQAAENGSSLSDISRKFCEDLVREYKHSRKCTTELFGSSSQFLTEFIKGIKTAVGLLDIHCTFAFSRSAALTIHKLLMMSESQRLTRRDDEFLESLVEFLFLTNLLDWGCVFEPLYCTLLASRLLNQDRFSLEHEKKVCNALRACFPHDRPVLMLQDVEHSKFLWNGFISHKLEMFDTLAQWVTSSQLSFKRIEIKQKAMEEDWRKFSLYKNGSLNVYVGSPVAWNLRATCTQAVPNMLRSLNSDLISFIVDYERFFMCAYTRSVSPNHSSKPRPLHWTGEGWAEVRDVVTGQTFKVTTVQMILLLHFKFQAFSDASEEVNISDWKHAFPHHWKSALDALCKAHLIELPSENLAVLTSCRSDSETPQLVDLTSTSTEDIEMCCKVDDVERLTEQRNNVMDCAIVRHVKKKPCQINSLVFNVIKHCLGETNDDMPDKTEGYDSTESNLFFQDFLSEKMDSQHFLALSSEVRARCEMLIDLGYIKRDPERPQIVQYVPELPPIRSRTSTVCTQEAVDEEKDLNEEEAKVLNEEETTDLPESREEITTDENIEKDEAVLHSTNEDKISEKEIHEEIQIIEEESPSALNESSVSSRPTVPGAIPKTSAGKVIDSDSSAKQTVWQLLHGMSFNHTRIILRGVCQSLSKQEVLTRIEKSITTLSEVISCDKNISEALLLQMDWRVNDLIEHVSTNRAATLRSVGVREDKKEEEAIENPKKKVKRQTSVDDCCPVCTNDLDLSQSHALQCGHRCCMDCWKTYLTQKLDDNQTANTKCPVAKCDARPTTESFQKIFAQEEDIVARYQTVLVRSYVESDRSLTWCHCPTGCDTVVRKDSSWSNIGTCTICGWETCFSCTYVEAHFPASCGHMSQWLEDGGYYEGMGEDARSKHLARIIAKRCPNCQANIEKDDGCLHMKCLKCSHDFCWRCLKAWRPTHRDYYKCTAKVSKLAQSGIRFQEHNKKCQFHHKAKLFPMNILKRLQTVDACTVPSVNISYAVRACALLIRARKVLAYCNIFSYYSADTERMNAMELHSQVLENNTLQLQQLLDEVLLSLADINYALSNMKFSDCCKIEELFVMIGKQLKNLLQFSSQDMKIGLSSSGDKVESSSEKKKDVDDPPPPSTVITNARPAGMSDEEDEDDIFGMWRQGGMIELEGAVDRLHSWADRLDNDAVDEGEDDDEDVDDEDNFPSSDDSFSDDDDDDDDEEEEDSDDVNRISDDTLDTEYEEDDIFDRFMF